jgi:voltage-gated potassium channel
MESPFGKLRWSRVPLKAWDGLVVVAAASYATVLPLELLYPVLSRGPAAIVMWTAIVLFVVDIPVCLYRARRRPSGRPFSERSGLGEYVRSWLPMDVLAALPLGTLALYPGTGIPGLAKLAKVGHIFGQWRQRELRYSGQLLLLFAVYWLALAVHWMACGWLALRDPDPSVGLPANYIDSLYWTLSTLTTVGYGDITPDNPAQKLYAVATMAVGLGFFGYVVGVIASILSKRDPSRALFLENIEKLSVAVRYGKIPPDLQRRIYEYHYYIWKQRLGYDESDFLSELPRSLKEEVSLHMKSDVLERVELFRGADPEFVKAVALRLTPMVLTPGDWVFHEGDEGRGMYFISRGELEVVASPGSRRIATLKEGDFFGEIALFMDLPRTASVRALTYCDVYGLSRAAFQHVQRRFPQSVAEIERKATTRHERDLAGSSELAEGGVNEDGSGASVPVR